MKKVLLIIFITTLSSCNQTKIAYVDVEALMKDYKATVALEDEYKSEQEKIAKKLDSMGAPFKTKLANYYQNAKKMSAKKRSETEQALQQEQQMLQMMQQQASQELQNSTQKKSEEITKRIDSFVANYAKEKGYNLIIGTSGKGTVMYGDDNINITDEILEILNNDFSK